jgi:hypothetical protein
VQPVKATGKGKNELLAEWMGLFAVFSFEMH